MKSFLFFAVLAVAGCGVCGAAGGGCLFYTSDAGGEKRGGWVGGWVRPVTKKMATMM